MKDLLFALCQAEGASGEEFLAGEIAKEALQKYACVQRDASGNIIARMGKKGARPHIMLDAHIDQIGLIVTDIDSNGFLRVAACGGIDRRVLAGNTVRVLAKQTLTGIICCQPPHLSGGKSEALKADEIFVDVGLSEEAAREIVALGDRVQFLSSPAALQNARVAAQALDNRAGVAALIRCAEILHTADLDVEVTILLSVQEETGALGASVGAFSVSPDEAISVDVSFAAQPGVPGHKCGKLAHGPMIGVAPTLSKKVTDTLVDLAKRENIEYQLEIMGGITGTNADKISVSKSGVSTGLVSIPQRYMHTPVEVVCLDDIEKVAALLAMYVKNGGSRDVR